MNQHLYDLRDDDLLDLDDPMKATKTLAEREGWTLEEAEEKMKSYFSAFPDLERWLKEIPRTKKIEPIGE